MIHAPKTLETHRLALRWFTAEDAALMLAIWNDPAFMRHVGDRGFRTIEQAEAAVESGMVQGYATLGYGPYRVSLLSDDTPIGICGLFQREYLSMPDLGFCVLPDYRQQGFTEEASRIVLEMTGQVLKLNRVAAIVSEGNHASMALIRKLGGVEGPGADGLPDATRLLTVPLDPYR